METQQVADRFKQIRFNLQKSQMELATMLGVDQKRISRTEQGQQDLNGEFLTSLRDKIGLNINWLLFGEGEMFSSGTGSNIETMPVYKMWTNPRTIWSPENGEKENNPLVFDKNIFTQSFRTEDDEDSFRFVAFRMRAKDETSPISNNELFIAKLQNEGDQTFYGWACYIYQWHEALLVGYLSRKDDKTLCSWKHKNNDAVIWHDIPLDKNLHIIGRVRLVMTQH